METLTHWKKNNDSRYISGEDLKSGFHGLKPEMTVVIEKFEDTDTFDQTQQKKLVRTGFWMKELNGPAVYKPVILNNTNAAFCVKEFGSIYMEHWLNKPLVLYALADKRHGHVARFKKYYAPVTNSDVEALKIVSASTTLEELKINWEKLTIIDRKLPTVIAKKEELKNTLK